MRWGNVCIIIWGRTGTGDWLLWTRERNFEFQNRCDNLLVTRANINLERRLLHGIPYISYVLFSTFFSMTRQPLVGPCPLIFETWRSHSDTHHTRYGSSGRVISLTKRPLPDNTQHSKETDIHVSDGIRTRIPSKRAAAGPRLRQRGHWDRLRLYTIK
jgi:hypothetical protein